MKDCMELMRIGETNGSELRGCKNGDEEVEEEESTRSGWDYK